MYIDGSDVILVSYERGTMQPATMKKYAKELLKRTKKKFPNNIVIVKEKSVEITVLK